MRICMLCGEETFDNHRGDECFDSMQRQLTAARAQLAARDARLRECEELFRRALPHIGPRILEKAIRDLLKRIEAALSPRFEVQAYSEDNDGTVV